MLSTKGHPSALLSDKDRVCLESMTCESPQFLLRSQTALGARGGNGASWVTVRSRPSTITPRYVLWVVLIVFTPSIRPLFHSKPPHMWRSLRYVFVWQACAACKDRREREKGQKANEAISTIIGSSWPGRLSYGRKASELMGSHRWTMGRDEFVLQLENRSLSPRYFPREV